MTFDECMTLWGCSYGVSRVSSDYIDVVINTPYDFCLKERLPASRCYIEGHARDINPCVVVFTDKWLEEYTIRSIRDVIKIRRNTPYFTYKETLNNIHKYEKGIIPMSALKESFPSLFNTENKHPKRSGLFPYGIKKVIFNDPATIVFWDDGTKTVTKCHGDDIYDETTGLLVCISKKFLGGASALKKTIDKWLPEKKDEEEKSVVSDSYKHCARCGHCFKLDEKMYAHELYGKAPICKECNDDLIKKDIRLRFGGKD